MACVCCYKTSIFAELLPSQLTKVTVMKNECCFGWNSVKQTLKDFAFFFFLGNNMLLRKGPVQGLTSCLSSKILLPGCMEAVMPQKSTIRIKALNAEVLQLGNAYSSLHLKLVFVQNDKNYAGWKRSLRSWNPTVADMHNNHTLKLDVENLWFKNLGSPLNWQKWCKTLFLKSTLMMKILIFFCAKVHVFYL